MYLFYTTYNTIEFFNDKKMLTVIWKFLIAMKKKKYYKVDPSKLFGAQFTKTSFYKIYIYNDH